MRRKICVVTGTRAEYGLLSNLMNEIRKDSHLDLQIVVTGMHLSSEFGLTYKLIEEDGFIINEKIEMLLSSDTPTGVAKSMGLATIGFTDAFDRLKPDIIVILGDRYEMLAVAQVALIMRIPIAHISGGEVTEGVIDDSIRHSITKMSHIHFTANKEYRSRVIQLGEQPDKVFDVGDPGVENIKRIIYLSKNELKKYFGFNLDKFFLITFHPSTLETNTAEIQIKSLLSALEKYPDYQLIFTKSNADTDGRIINDLIDEYVALNSDRAKAYFSLGQLRYLSTLKICNAVIGNSSSGIVEAPVFSIPTINIGDRQKGRLKSNSIIDCGVTEQEIIDAINKSISNEFQNTMKHVDLKYDSESTTDKIMDILKKVEIKAIIKKSFYDIS